MRTRRVIESEEKLAVGLGFGDYVIFDKTETPGQPTIMFQKKACGLRSANKGFNIGRWLSFNILRCKWGFVL